MRPRKRIKRWAGLLSTRERENMSESYHRRVAIKSATQSHHDIITEAWMAGFEQAEYLYNVIRQKENENLI